MGERTSKKLHYLYFMMTLMIIGIHSVSTKSMGFTGISESINNYVRILFDAATGGFFFFSAYLLFLNEKNDYVRLLAKRCRTLFLPYVIYNVVALLYKEVFRNIILSEQLPKLSTDYLVKQILLSEANPPLWFMRVLMEFVIIYPFIRLLLKDKKASWGGVIISIILHLLIGVDEGYSTIHYWFPIYLLGGLFARYYKPWIESTKWYNIEKVAAIVAFAVLIGFAPLNRYVYYVYRIAAPLLLWILSETFAKFPKAPWFVRCTIFYYGMHIIVISPVAKLMSYFCRDSQILLVMTNILVPVACAAVMIPMAVILRKWFRPIWGVLIGGRK